MNLGSCHCLGTCLQRNLRLFFKVTKNIVRWWYGSYPTIESIITYSSLDHLLAYGEQTSYNSIYTALRI